MKDFRINELIFSSLQPPEIGIITPILRFKEMKWQWKASECQKLDHLARSVCLYMSYLLNVQFQSKDSSFMQNPLPWLSNSKILS